MEAFKKKVWLATPTMHGEEIEYIKQAYDTNWMSTLGENINEVERIAAEKAEMKYAVSLSCCTAALHLAVKHAGETLYGKPKAGCGALTGKRVFCSDMTFAATMNPVVYEGGILTVENRPVLQVGFLFVVFFTKHFISLFQYGSSSESLLIKYLPCSKRA